MDEVKGPIWSQDVIFALRDGAELLNGPECVLDHVVSASGRTMVLRDAQGKTWTVTVEVT